MPRIDPAQLLRCLGVLLSKTGGIVSKGEVNRVANLMGKFSKKLVSKCIYVSILKATEIDILDMFMSAGGWDLVFSWLSDGITAMNWAFVEELVELLLICPVNIDRLKGNNCPKVIKLLSKNPSATDKVRELAEIVVERWLAMVKEATSQPGAAAPQEPVSSTTQPKKDDESEKEAEDSSSVYKITIKDGPQVVAQVISSDKAEPIVDTPVVAPEVTAEPAPQPEISGTKRPASSSDDEEDISPKKKSTAVLRESSEESETSDEEWHVKKKKTPGRKRAAPKPVAEKKSPVAPKKRKQKAEKPPVEKPEKASKKKEEKVVELIHPPSVKPVKKSMLNKLSLKTHKEVEKEKVVVDEFADQDRQTLAKLVAPSLSGMGRIPKKHKDGDEKKEDKKEEKKVVKKLETPPKPPPKPAPKNPSKYNYTPSVGKRDVTERPKTVKTFNAKFRSTGLEEEPPPPPKSVKKPEKKEESKEVKKEHSKLQSPPPSSSPTSKKHREHSVSPPKTVVKEEDKSHDKAAASKPKLMQLQESNMFGDALAAAFVPTSAKKKKKRTSSTDVKKETESAVKPLPEIKEVKKEEKEPAKPKLKFYQDTLITDEDETPPEVKKEKDEDDSVCPVSQSEIEDELSKTEEAISNFVKQEEKKNFEREKFRLPQGILVYYKKKKIIKKSVVWRPGESIQEVRFFELDETERVNVTKNFTDMKLLEKANEREAFLHSRRIASHDAMEERTQWMPLIPIDIPSQEFIIEPGKNSHERDAQAQRERTIVPALYFHKKMIPDTPSEPDLEIHAHTEPVTIPLNDMTSNPESVISYKDKGWPEPLETPPEPLLETPELMAPNIPPEMLMNGPPPGLQMPPGQFPCPMPPGFFPPATMAPLMGPGGWVPGTETPQPLFNGPPQDLMSMGGPPMMDAMPFMPNMGPGMVPPMGPGPNINQNYMGGPPQGPPMNFNQPPSNHYNDGPGPRPSRPWFRGHGGPNQWRHPNKGGAPWKSSKTCINIIKRGFCKTPHCAFKHPAPNMSYS